MTAFMYTGHYGIPPATLSGSVRNDLMMIKEVLGVGEIAISDHRAPQPSTEELARVVIDAHVGGILSRKAGITHFHIGESPRRLRPLFDLLEQYPEVEPGFLYPSHINRSRELLAEAVDLASRGAFVGDGPRPGPDQEHRHRPARLRAHMLQTFPIEAGPSGRPPGKTPKATQRREL